MMQSRRHAVTTSLLLLCPKCLFCNQVFWKFCRLHNLQKLGTRRTASWERILESIQKRSQKMSVSTISNLVVFSLDNLILGFAKILSYSLALRLRVVAPPPTTNKKASFCRSTTRKDNDDNDKSFLLSPPPPPPSVNVASDGGVAAAVAAATSSIANDVRFFFFADPKSAKILSFLRCSTFNRKARYLLVCSITLGDTSMVRRESTQAFSIP